MDSLKSPSVFLRIINIIYPIFIFILLLFNYTYEIIICQGKLNVITDTQVTFCVSFFFILRKLIINFFLIRQQQQLLQQRLQLEIIQW